MNIVFGIVIVLIIILSLVYLLRKKVYSLMSAGLKIGFFLCILITFSALFVPSIYDLLADASLRSAGTLEGIRELDDKTGVVSIKENTQSAWEDVKNFFTGDEESEEEESDSKGYFENTVYPGLIYILSGFYRASAVISSLAGLILITYLSYTVSENEDYETLKKDYRKLKKRVAALEERGFQN